ncbi:hypothetical protein ACUXV3_15995 [Roseobacteraceae bacterium NS-SX3]
MAASIEHFFLGPKDNICREAPLTKPVFARSSTIENKYQPNPSDGPSSKHDGPAQQKERRAKGNYSQNQIKTVTPVQWQQQEKPGHQGKRNRKARQKHG